MNTQGDGQPVAARGHDLALGPSVLALSVVALAAACNGGSARDPGGTVVPYDSVYASEQSGVESPLREVVRNSEEWSAVWSTISADRSPAPPLPAVDFERFMLLAVGLGTRPSGGYAARIGGIVAGGDTLTVTVVEVAPGAGCIATMALTAPVVVVRIDRLDAEVEFVESRQERACD